MTDEVFALLLDYRSAELNLKARHDGLDAWERAELRAIEAHRDKAPAVAQRIRVLAVKMVQPNIWRLLMARFCKKFRRNLAELEALVHYGHSAAVWEIAYLSRKQACQKLGPEEATELELLKRYHDSPDVVRITRLKLKERVGELSAAESRELASLQRNQYMHGGVPEQIFEMLWAPRDAAPALDLSRP